MRRKGGRDRIKGGVLGKMKRRRGELGLYKGGVLGRMRGGPRLRVVY